MRNHLLFSINAYVVVLALVALTTSQAYAEPTQRDTKATKVKKPTKAKSAREDNGQRIGCRSGDQ